MTTTDGAKYRKVSLDAILADAVEELIEERPEVAKNLSRFVDDAVRRRLEEVNATLTSSG